MRGRWSKENLTNALEAVAAGIVVNRANFNFHVSRRILRRYLHERTYEKSSLERKTILTAEMELSGRIIRRAEIEYPITFKVL